jgi:hypothetical protein
MRSDRMVPIASQSGEADEVKAKLLARQRKDRNAR